MLNLLKYYHKYHYILNNSCQVIKLKNKGKDLVGNHFVDNTNHLNRFIISCENFQNTQDPNGLINVGFLNIIICKLKDRAADWILLDLELN